MNPSAPTAAESYRLARRALLAFVLTFIASRAMVFLVMSRRIPNMYFFLQGTHVHHLNYGIFLLAAVAAYLLFARPEGKIARAVALAYGIAMGLTFDEFGMWLHLGGSYWQRASVDAVIVVAGVLGVIAFAPSLERLEAHHRWALLALVLGLALFVFVLFDTGARIGTLVGPRLRELELSSSP